LAAPADTCKFRSLAVGAFLPRVVRVLSASLRNGQIRLKARSEARNEHDLWVGQFGQAPPASSAILRIFAIMANRELAWYAFVPPDFLARSFRVLREVFIPFDEIFVDGILRRFQGRKIAVVNDCPSHTTEYRLDDIQELRARWQRKEFHLWTPIAFHIIDLSNARVHCF
jgi:hypothetical protein